MGMEFEEGGTVLKILYDTLGRRPTKILVWIVASAALIATTRWVIENIEWYAVRYDWGSFMNFNWANALYTLLVVLISTLAMVGIGAAIGAILGYVLRIGLATPLQRRIDRKLKQVTELLKIVSKYTVRSEDKLTVNKLLYEAEEMYSSWHDSKTMKFIRWPEKKLKAKEVDKDGK